MSNQILRCIMCLGSAGIRYVGFTPIGYMVLTPGEGILYCRVNNWRYLFLIALCCHLVKESLTAESITGVTCVAYYL